MSALDHAVRQGKALYAGISNYDPERTRAAARILRDLGTPCIIHQPPYNMLNRKPEDGLLRALQEDGIGCIAFSPLAQGLLTDRYAQGIPSDSRAAKDHGALNRDRLTPETLEKLSSLRAIARDRGQSLAQMAIAWLLHRPELTSVLIGASRVSQLEENIAALDSLRFDPGELDAIDSVLRL